MMKKLRLLIWLAIMGIIGLSAWMVYYAKTPLNIRPDAQEITIQPNSSLRSIAQQLVKQGVLKNEWSFIVLARVLRKESYLQAGDYTLNKNINPYQLLLSLNHGKSTQGSITFIEGRTFKQMRERLAKNKAIKHSIQLLTDAEVMQLVGKGEPHAEGLFFPDTFYFDRNTLDTIILKRSYEIMQTKLAKAWEARDANLPYKTPYQALIMASIIEKETGQASERALIAGVFVNRLRIGMRLQTDPTIIYGMGDDFNGNIRRKDLLKDTPYNTYTRNGLPPTPIAMPGLASIQAALHPAKTKALYFVGKGDGSHAFSSNLAEHNRAVVKYQLKR
ncbi:MAG: endolytic transglycosylase MltG [Methylophilus sp.]|nr:endolytic transglycosylase MltG [Methylophilus sp.]MDP3609215.1 endolytic transglycosylase MltG [Methylophilus sp.]